MISTSLIRRRKARSTQRVARERGSMSALTAAANTHQRQA